MKSLFVLIGILSFQSAMADFLPQSFSAKFEQEYLSILKGKAKKGQGTVEYKYPGHIRFETSTPSAVVFVSNGAKAWYYRAPFIEGEEGEVTETSAKEGSSAYIKFFDSLKNGLSSNSLYDVKKQNDYYNVVFSSKTVKEIGIKEAKLSFSSKKAADFSELKSIDLLFKDGKKSTLRFSEMKINPVFDAERFNFVAPPKTKKN